MDFEPIDRYLLDGTPSRAEVVRALLAKPANEPKALPFYEGMRLLGARTPDLTLIALRLVLSGKRADDASVIALRDLIDRARREGGDAIAARDAYRAAVA
ncbi:MAG: hypothetical protein M3R51_07305 [Candidatus Eremiobacteraeota bacterium]|nr:hypothetical protein [Candidatus Eremiobacteraeota bacterium]